MRNGAGAVGPDTAVRLAPEGIDLRLIQLYAVQRGLGLLAVERAEEGKDGLREDWEKRKGAVNIDLRVAGLQRSSAYSTQKSGNHHVPSAVGWV